MIDLDKAAGFLERHGREVERVRFRYHFADGSLDDLLSALAEYQNPDGGFGHGLEPDLKARESNPFATELALTICLWADVPRDHPLLARTVDYLERTQTEEGDWRFSEAVYGDEMAPWFREWQFPNLNPGCTTAGLLKALDLGSERLHARAAALLERLAKPEDLISGGFYGARPYAMYFLPRSKEWDHPARGFYLGGVLWWLIRSHVEGTIEDGNHFFEYIRTPETALGRGMPPPILEAKLDLLESEQAEDGGWPVPYGAHWRSWATMQNLLTLQAFGRI